MKNILFLALILVACSNPTKQHEQASSDTSTNTDTLPVYKQIDLKSIYDSAGFKGCFVLYDRNQNTYLLYDSAAVFTPHLPASTFKIFNSIIALETGTVKDENVVFKWDSEKRWVESWNKDQNLHEAFQNSTVWYYQELARRMGKQTIKHYLDTFAYTNGDTSGAVDMIWLDGSLRVNAMQQVEFLQKIQKRSLPVSLRTYKILEHIMIADSNQNYVLRAKTGWADTDTSAVGWYVGYYTTSDNVYFFANCLLSEGETPDNFAQARKNIVNAVFKKLNLLPQ